jgi:hypothetical protein
MTDEKVMEALNSMGIFSELIQSIKDGEIYPAPKEAVGKDEKIIGELTPSEKLLWTAMFKIVNKLATLNKQSMIAEQRGEKVDALQKGLNLQRFQTAKCFAEAFSADLWLRIRERFGDTVIANESIAVREGYKIVSLKPDIDEELPMILAISVCTRSTGSGHLNS